MKKHILPMVSCIALQSACTTTSDLQLQTETGQAYRGKTITYSIHPRPDFLAVTAGKDFFEFGGYVPGAVKSGNDIVEIYNIPDPAATIGVTIATDLTQKYGMILLHPKAQTTERASKGVSADHQYADLVVDVRTWAWGLNYDHTNWNRYYIGYHAYLRLIDTQTAEVLAFTSYAYSSRDQEKYLTQEELMSHGAAGLKKEFLKAQSSCILDCRQRIFNAR